MVREIGNATLETVDNSFALLGNSNAREVLRFRLCFRLTSERERTILHNMRMIPQHPGRTTKKQENTYRLDLNNLVALSSFGHYKGALRVNRE